MLSTNLKKVKTSDIELKDRLVAINRVTKVTKGGRAFTFSAIVVVGDEKGVVGYGLGKAKEVTDAVSKGVDDAKKNLVKVSVAKGTVPHEQIGKFGGALVLLKPAAPGTGVIAGGAMRAVLESVGITDVLAKSKGSSNPHNVVKATIDALAQMRDAIGVSQQRGVAMEKYLKANNLKNIPVNYRLTDMGKITIKQVKSGIDRPYRQKRTLQALGFRKLNQTIEKEATPQIMGMIHSVQHLVAVVKKG